MNRKQADELTGEFLSELKSRMIGPSEENESLFEKPNKRYLTAMLFPRGAGAAAATFDEQELPDDAQEDEEEDDPGDSPADLLFQKLPASIGLTFAIADAESSIAVALAAGRYERSAADSLTSGGSQRRQMLWKRVSVYSAGSAEQVRVAAVDGRSDPIPVLHGCAELQIYIRRARGVRIATVSLINRAEAEDSGAFRVEDVLFQVQMRCAPSAGVISYPDPEYVQEDPEALELELQYRSRPTFGVGHGCAAHWPRTQAMQVDEVCAEFLPSVEVPPVTTEIGSLSGEAKSCLSLVALQDSRFDPIPALKKFVGHYDDWRELLGSQTLSERFQKARTRLLNGIDTAATRMRDGIRLLEDDPIALQVFRLANRAMLLNIARATANRRRRAGEAWRDVNFDQLTASDYVWRPFQLAFFLLSLRGLWQPKHADRSVVDLIWFPTGGGKTEAYLGVAAFEMIRRRLVCGSQGDGTAVIKRYTLRLLTIQQFERAGGLICALDSLRRRSEIPGSPFTLGLWVGEASSPNTHAAAFADLTKIYASIGRVDGVKVPLKRCPVCGSAIIPEKKREGAEGVGLRAVSGRVQLYCPNSGCPFHAALPISYIDDDLYAQPPTLLLGTVDKFAMLAWRDEARSFFGTGSDRLPPTLIIQDELHLISGPLGTLAGLYEAAIDTVISKRGVPAKYICATATIRRAADQILKLYARPSAIFPPPGLDASDSYFSRSQLDRPGRIYVGAMGQGHTPTFSNVIASAALLAAGGELRSRIGDGADTWWTVVAYHNSKRELGKTLSLARDDIPARLKALGEGRDVPGAGVRELSANLRDSEIPQVLHELGISLPGDGALDFVACTNMLSVGVDVSRLGLMMINGQPKTVAEYIQASSRVGRDPERPPGIILSLFSPTKPRDRSHFEFFTAFHNGFYRFVEPTSVTPFALPAIQRGLHGAFVALVRMSSSVHANNHASHVNRAMAEIRDLGGAFLSRVAAAKDGVPAEAAARLDAFIDGWANAAREKGARIRFQSAGKEHPGIIKPFRRGGSTGWETLQSLRHVDTPLQLKVPTMQVGTTP